MIRRLLKMFLPLTAEEKARKMFFSIQLDETDIAIDCGANVGEITDHLSKSGATVYAFEPNPYAFKKLSDRFTGQENVHCINKGVLDKNGSVRLYFHENSDDDEIYWSTGSSILDYKSNVKKEKYHDITVIDLSEFIIGLGSRVKVLKIDVEGVEIEILNKMIGEESINMVDNVFVETHDDKIPELKDPTDNLRNKIHEMNIKNINLDWT